MTAIILAAGKGTRMNSDQAKVLHEVCGRPMLAYVVDAAGKAGCDNLIIVIGYGGEAVRRSFAELDGSAAWVEQTRQLGTGHAVIVCREHLEKLSGPVLVLAGDGPLIRPETLRQLLAEHTDSGAACTLATSIMPDPGTYGRIVRNQQGQLEAIVEYLDADAGQRLINEVNVSLYCFDATALCSVLDELKNDNAKGEYYITDAISLLRARGEKLAVVAAVPPEDVISINTAEQLDQVNRIMAARLSQRGSLADG